MCSMSGDTQKGSGLRLLQPEQQEGAQEVCGWESGGAGDRYQRYRQSRHLHRGHYRFQRQEMNAAQNETPD